jgi:hypothetical protein
MMAAGLMPFRRASLSLTVLALMSGCAQTPPVDATPPVPRPTPPVETTDPSQAELRKARAERNRAANAAATKAVYNASPTSQSQRDYYASAEAGLLARGRLRRDRVPMDAPLDAEMLTRDFIEIALRDEYSRDGAGLVARTEVAPLRRWQVPVTMQLEFGGSADKALRSSFRADIAEFGNRVTAASGHPVSLTAGGGNFLILILTDDERRQIGPRLSQLVPGMPAQDIGIIENLDEQNFCTVFAYSQGNAPEYARAVALIRAELPPLLRLSCIHEELAQGMGLSNDSPTARPSIFNDDEEFALLTRHDELLLRILYDPRLRPGMDEAEATPIVRRIAAELLGETI